jgi:hypothetical protein
VSSLRNRLSSSSISSSTKSTISIDTSCWGINRSLLQPTHCALACCLKSNSVSTTRYPTIGSRLPSSFWKGSTPFKRRCPPQDSSS